MHTLMQNEALTDESDLFEVQHRLGNIHANLKDYDNAMLCYLDVLDFQRRTNGDEDINVAD
eukprot:6979444-Ditylum_brightwellii.AAC.1